MDEIPKVSSTYELILNEKAIEKKQGELFEIDESLLKISHSRRPIGLAKALDTELKRLIKIEKIAFAIEIEVDDLKNGGKKKFDVINPELINKVNLFAEEFKS